MSFILDALRKAEQDNLVGKNHGPKQGVHDIQSQTISPLKGWIAALILVNLVTLLVFIGYNGFDTPERKVLSDEMNHNDVSRDIGSTPNVKIREEQKESEKQQNSEGRTQLTFADIIADSEKKGVRSLEKKEQLRIEKNTRKSRPEQHRKKEKNNPERAAIDHDNSRELSFQAESESERKNQQRSEYIPELKELPLDFRRSVPAINVNVFVYSEDVSERFVIIDMVKYSTGNLLPENLLLKEIRSDSLVLEYRDKIFRIKRP